MGFMYILRCADGAYYTESTRNLEARFYERNSGNWANFTKRRLPVELVYYEEYERVDDAFYREKQIQGWTRRKKEALIEMRHEQLPALAKKVWKK